MKKKLKQQGLAIIIYARMNSKRLPNKVLMEVNSKVLLKLIIDRINIYNKNKYPIIVATSTNRHDNLIASYCKKNNIQFFRGDLHNVFNRTIQCIKKYSLEGFVRVCADRPFFDVKLMNRMINKYKSNNFDIITNQLDRTYPKGLACEVSSAKIFQDMEQNTLNSKEKEHIFNYFYKKKKKYRIFNFKLNTLKNKKNINYSINDSKDLLKISKILKKYNKIEYIDILKLEK